MKEIKELFPFIKPYWLVMAFAIFCMIVLTFMNLAGPWIIRILIQTITEGVGGEFDFSRINILAISVIIIYIFRAFAQFGTNYVSHYAAWKALEDIRQYLYRHIQNLSLKFFQDKQTGEIMSRVVDDTRNFEQLIAHAIPTIIVNAFVLIGVTFILFFMNVPLALYTLIPVPFLALVVFKFSKISRPVFKKAQKDIADVNAVLQDNFSGIKEIKTFTQENNEEKKVFQRISNFTINILQAIKLSATYEPVIQFISGIGTVIVIFFGGRLALTGNLALEDLVAFLLYLGMFYQPITALGRINEGLQQALASAERVIDVLNTKPDIVDSPSAKKLTDVQGYLELQNVNFSYIKDIPILKDISFKMKAGETVALVGPTGVGKSTIAHIIPRFYDLNSGKILIDDIDITEITLTSLRQQISLVSQDIFLFNGTIKDNILFSRPQAKEEEMITASKAANAHQFILELKDGYNTEIGERGVKLSGGQKQRLSIARAILKDAPILILDEATSSVDTETEKLIQEALNRLMTNKTTIIIAHRLSTIQQANQIIVLKEGSIIEKGNHEQLIKENGLYKKLWQINGQVLAV